MMCLRIVKMTVYLKENGYNSYHIDSRIKDVFVLYVVEYGPKFFAMNKKIMRMHTRALL